MFLNTKFKPLAIFCGCTAWFVSDQVGNPEDRFSHNEAQIIQNSLPNIYMGGIVADGGHILSVR